ncbi:flagellar hook-associated protein 3 [Pseudomonas sp. LS1212]|uniref:flagellar hook-associated protein 3 n=1 Tax=Pseudomonas sp. LS1212 TaxID=2972478 RepID=UPI00215D0BC2|nr:flagellar hook-associated protein 3 [Pseudomonas sp. LS1212]UVJ45416.1 flagellar hook-associated protein 3 [Pseudomonas sp. LS1212]
MRISTSQYFETSAANYSKSFADTSRIHEQIVSGARIQTASDDPIGAARLLQLQQQSSLLTQYSGNMTTVTNSLNQSESVLDSITTALQRARELTIGAGSGSLSDVDRASIASEIGEIEANVFSLLNSRDANGQYIFSGSKTTTPPYVRNGDGTYTYQGDQTQLSLQISDTLSVATNDTGFSAFEQAVNTARTRSALTLPATDDGRVTVSAGHMNSQGSYSKAYTAGQPYTLTFVSSTQYTITDGAGNDITAETANNGTFDPNKEGGSEINLRGVSFDLDITLQPTDTNPDAVIAGHVFTLDSKPDNLNASRAAANASTAQITGSSISNSGDYASTFPSTGAVIKFTSATDYAVYAQPVTADSKAIANGTMSGSSITAAGVTFDISGAPASGDQYVVQVNSHKTRNVLDTLSNLRTALNTPVTGDRQAQLKLQNSLDEALGNITSASERVDVTRGSIGGRGNMLDIQKAENTSLALANKSTQSAIGDTDMATASIALTLQQTMLQASQLAFAKISQLSLFNKL